MQLIYDLFENEKFKIFIRYVIFAGIATCVDLGLLYSLTEYGNMWYLYSSLIATSFGMVTNYSLNKYLNFKNKSTRIVKQFSLFVLISMITVAINQAVLFALVEFTGLWYMLSRLLAIGVGFSWSFFGHNKLTFKME